MAKTPRKKTSPAASKPTQKEKRQETIQEMMAEAKRHREKNKDLIEKVRKDPELADKVRAEMCADLRRVYAIPRDILGPSASRDRYREHGRYSTALATYLFGLWAQFQREADIQPSLGIKTVERNISKTLRAQTAAKYADEHVRPWDGAYQRLDMDRDEVVLVIGSDFHIHTMSPFAKRVWREVLEVVQPDAVRYNGDGPDFPSISRHKQLPGHFALTLQEEIDLWTDFMAHDRALLPDADIRWILGNHDIRLITALAEAFPVYANLRSNRFNEQFKLDELEVGLVARSSFLNPTAKMKRTDIAQNWETLLDAQGRPFWTTVHGFLCGRGAPRKHLDRFMTFGTNGHLHDPQAVSGGSHATGVLRWWQSGCMGWPPAIAAGYIPGPIEASGWFSQFLVVTLFPRQRHVHVEEVTIDNMAAFRDWRWEITDEERDAQAEMLHI